VKLNKRKRLIAVIAIFFLFALTITFFTLTYTKEGNALIATNFIKNEATYKFDGIFETFKLN
jgi:capsular polysaccharide biosynthesis protein